MTRQRQPNRPIDIGIATAVIAEATPRARWADPPEWAGPDCHGQCLIWPDNLDSNGYGVTGWGGIRAHRLAYTAGAKTDPGELLIRHLCGNPPCFNYAHLVAGTDAENRADTIAMGRHKREAYAIPGHVAVEAARLINGGMTVQETAEHLGASYSALLRSVDGMLDPGVTKGRHTRKATDAEVLEARLDYTHGRATIREIATRLGMSWPAVQKMVQGRTYRHVGSAHTGETVKIYRATPRCSVHGCTKSAIAKGLCTGHYNRLATHGDVQASKPLRPHPADVTLTDDDHAEIRRLYTAGHSINQIAKRYGVAWTRIDGIVDHNAERSRDERGPDQRTNLTADKVRAIRQRREAGETLAKIAADIGVSISVVHKVTTRQTWRHVT